jgi:hypothetical protein
MLLPLVLLVLVSVFLFFSSFLIHFFTASALPTSHVTSLEKGLDSLGTALAFPLF